MAADPVVVRVGTLDTNGHELEYMRDRVREAGAARRRDDVRRDHPGGHGNPRLATGTGGRRRGHRAVGGRAEARPATALAERQLVMVGGQIAAERSATELQDDPDAQRRFLGVEPIATEE